MIYDFFEKFALQEKCPNIARKKPKTSAKAAGCKKFPNLPSIRTAAHAPALVCKTAENTKTTFPRTSFPTYHIRKATALSWRSKRSHRLSAVPLVMLRITAFRGAVMGGAALGNPLPHQISTKRKFHRSFRQKSQKHPQILRNAGVPWCRQPESNRHGFNTGGF